MSTLPNSLFNICHRIIRIKMVGATNSNVTCIISYWHHITFLQLVPTLCGASIISTFNPEDWNKKSLRNVTSKLPGFNTMVWSRKHEQPRIPQSLQHTFVPGISQNYERRRKTQKLRQSFWKMYAAGAALECFTPFNSSCKLIIRGKFHDVASSVFLSFMGNYDECWLSKLWPSDKWMDGWMDGQMDIGCRTANTGQYHKRKNDLSPYFHFFNGTWSRDSSVSVVKKTGDSTI